MPPLVEQCGGYCSSLPSLPIFFFFASVSKEGPPSGKETQALITHRATGAGGAPRHHSPPPLNLCKTVSFLMTFSTPVWQRATTLSEGRYSCYTNTANTDTAAHPLPPPATGAHRRISCPKASFLQLFLLDTTVSEKQTTELSPAMASLHVLKSSIWEHSRDVLSGGTSPSKHIYNELSRKDDILYLLKSMGVLQLTSVEHGFSTVFYQRL